MTETHILDTAEVDLAYDVRGPLPTADGRPPLLMIGQPMDAERLRRAGVALPRPHRRHLRPARAGPQRPQGRPSRPTPTVQADDVHALIEALGAGPVEMFASSGGAVTALALVAAHPDDVTTLVAHEPPMIAGAPRRRRPPARHGRRPGRLPGQGLGRGMAAFIAMTSWQGEFTDDYFAQPAPDPGAFGMPTEDDGSRDDPLLSDRAWRSPTTDPTSTR